MEDKIIEFIRKKDFKFIEDIGQGGTGKTVLLKDEIIDEFFICKKYSPYNEKQKDLYFNNFINEIKILYKLYHKNVVRVFNYYLYPELKTGYILMEFIKGQNINDFLIENPHMVNDIFIQTINGFSYLESNNILHRDIRPENILISEEGYVKIIDFGFGKKIEINKDFDKSVSLNWRYEPPNDFAKNIYDFRTEIYFLGKLFEEIILDTKIKNFSYPDILKDMISREYDKRISKFSKIERRIITKESNGLEFSEEDKIIYQNFANNLTSIFKKIEQNAVYIKNLEKTIKCLENIYKNSILEDYIQNPSLISNCFVKGYYIYYKNSKFSTSSLKNFIKLFKSASVDEKHIILNNIWQRLDTIDRYEALDDYLPF